VERGRWSVVGGAWIVARRPVVLADGVAPVAQSGAMSMGDPDITCNLQHSIIPSTHVV
jgi:hypothetical protein